MAAGNFEKCKSLTAVSEGGWSDHPDDPGGATMKGVTLATYRAWCKLHGRPEPTKADLKVITDDEVSAIFKAQYWDTAHCDRLPLGVDYAVFDFAINSGPARAVMELQRVLGVAVDGAVGARTLAAVSEACTAEVNAAALIDHYQDSRLAFMRSLKTWKTFGQGWTRRVEKVRRQAKAMAVAQTPEKSSQEPVPRAAAADQKVTASPEGAGSALSIGSGAGAAITELGKQIQPLATTAGALQYVFIGLIVVGVALTAWSIIKKQRKAA